MDEELLGLVILKSPRSKTTSEENFDPPPLLRCLRPAVGPSNKYSSRDICDTEVPYLLSKKKKTSNLFNFKPLGCRY